MHESTQISRGEGTVTIIFDTESTTEVSAPVVRAGDYRQLVDSCFTQKELDFIDGGIDAEITFSFVMFDDVSPSETSYQYKVAIAEAEKDLGRLHRGMFLDVSSIKGFDGASYSLYTLSEPMEMQFEVPLYLRKDNRTYYVMTNTMGGYKLLKDIDDEPTTISVEAESIGDCLILYQDGIRPSEAATKIMKISSQHVFLFSIVVLLGIWLFVEKTHKRI